MSKFSESICLLHNNPIIFTPLIIKFYENLENQPKNILLSYLVLPLVLHQTTRNWFKSAKVTSSISSFKKRKKDKRNSKNENLFGLPERIQHYKIITNHCIQYAIDNNWLKINEDLSISPEKIIDSSNSNLQESYKAAANIYKIFNDLDIVTIYSLLGVKII